MPLAVFKQPVLNRTFFAQLFRELMTTITRKPKKRKTIIDPPTGISENGGSICIISQLHGIPEEDIRIDLEKRQLVISALMPEAIVKREVLVPEGSRIIRKKFHDGILEIIPGNPPVNIRCFFNKKDPV